MKKSLFPLIAAGLSLPAGAAILANPSITGSSPNHSSPYVADNVFDRDIDDYASNNQGTNTFLEFSFGSAVSFDSIVVVNRNTTAGSDWIANYTLTYADLSTSTITRTAAQGRGGIDSLGGLITTTTVRLDVETLGGGSTATIGNTGAMEIYFLRTPAGMSLIESVSVAASSNAYSGSYAAAQAINGFIGRGNNAEFASTAGTGTFVDFNLGSVQKVGGFDFFDRMAAGDQVSAFDLIFSVDNIFGNEDDVVRNYTGSTQSDEFAGINAQYVRYDVTNIGSSSNVGMNEIRFYAVPEPTTALLGGLGLLALLRRRR